MAEPAKTFEDLIVWQKSHQLTLLVYKIANRFPKVELYGLGSQIKRASVSVPSNIAEGFQRRGIQDKCRLLNIAQASLEEMRYQLILARDLDYADTNQALEMATEVARLLNAYVSAIRNSDS